MQTAHQHNTLLYTLRPKRDHFLALFSAMLCTGAAIFFGITRFTAPVSSFEMLPASPAVAVSTTQQPQKPVTKNPYHHLSLQAKTAVVYDVYAKKVLFDKDASRPRPLASLTKLMTGLVAYESAKPETSVLITPYAIETEGDSGLLVNETWQLKDLLPFTLMVSSNDGADAIAAAIGAIRQGDTQSVRTYEHVRAFVDIMNKRAQEIGLESMYFKNPSGLEEPSGEIGAMGTAEDIAELVAYIWEYAPDVLADTARVEKVFISDSGFVHKAKNTNPYVEYVQGILGSKTGYTDIAGGNLAVLYNAGLNHPIVVVVMGSTIDGRFKDIQALIEATYAYITSGWYAYEHATSTSTQH